MHIDVKWDNQDNWERENMTQGSKKRQHQFWGYWFFVLVFMATALLLFLCLWGIKNIATDTIVNQEEVVEIINKGFPYVAGLIDIIITTLITAWIQSKIEIRMNAPQLMICTREGKRIPISGVKKEKPNALVPKITVGKEQRRYRVVYAQIKNVGKGIMSKCIINNQCIAVNLEPGKDSELYIILYLPNKGDGPGADYVHHLPYQIHDSYGNVYTGEYTLSVKISTLQAQFSVKEKMTKEYR